MKVYIKGTFKPFGQNGVTIDVNPTNRFQEQYIGHIKISIRPGEKEFTAQTHIDISDGLLDYFKGSESNDSLLSEYKTIQMPMHEAIENIVKYLKYFYGIPEIDDLDENIRMASLYYWSLDGLKWDLVPERFESKWIGADIVYVLDDNLLSWMPVLTQRKVETFFAFTHLHKAFNETNTRHQWINATIAAELAFKEFITLYKPDTAPLIAYLPSPPLDKMYKTLLREYAGIESPMHKFLSKGATKRNELVHKPRQMRPTQQETLIYLLQVQVAILHLYTILYPNDPFFEYLFNHANSKLQIEEKA